METRKKKGLIITIIVLAILVVLLGGFIGYDKFIKKDSTKEISKTETKVKKEKESNSTEENNSNSIIDTIEKYGTYSIYMGQSNEGEYTLTLFTPKNQDTNEGFFTIVQATSMSYNNITGGFFEIKDSYIEFYSNMSDDNDKGSFARAFSMDKSDLYQDSKALSEGYSYQYRLKLNYENGKISNSKITFEKIN